MKNRPLLVTGIHRSGSTWLGHVISRCPRFGFVWEPLNHETVCYGRFNYEPMGWYPFIREDDCKKELSAFRRLVQFDYNYWAGFKDCYSVRRMARYVRDAYHFFRWKVENRRLLMKDPMAFFATEWIHGHLDAQVLIIVRSPMAFVASMFRAKWYMPLRSIIEQDSLTKAYPDPLVNEIRVFLEDGGDEFSIMACCLGWRYIHRLILRFREQHPEWLVIRHEDLVERPRDTIEKVFSYLEEVPGEQLWEFLESSLDGNASDKGNRRNRETLLRSYEKVLSAVEIDFVKKFCAPEFDELYSEGSEQ